MKRSGVAYSCSYALLVINVRPSAGVLFCFTRARWKKNGACTHYVMVSKFQWKPFRLATQRDPQNDWTATQNRVNYDVFTQAPLHQQPQKKKPLSFFVAVGAIFFTAPLFSPGLEDVLEEICRRVRLKDCHFILSTSSCFAILIVSRCVVHGITTMISMFFVHSWIGYTRQWGQAFIKSDFKAAVWSPCFYCTSITQLPFFRYSALLMVIGLAWPPLLTSMSLPGVET